MEYEEEVMHAQEEFETEVTNAGLVEEWDQLVQDVQTEMEGCNIDMKRIRLSTKSLRSRQAAAATSLRSFSQDFHDNKPTPQEIEEAEQIIQEWFERGEGIINDAQPAVQARDERLVEAWERAEAEE